MFETVVICLTSIALGYVIALLAVRSMKREALADKVVDLTGRVNALDGMVNAALAKANDKSRKRKARKPAPKKRKDKEKPAPVAEVPQPRKKEKKQEPQLVA